ncbi:MAG: DNA mismatch repair protein MutS, partial [Deltaproteobacteria bacterium]|nr:DNA mismatch repair protein MutS [Deltaproteobacteria bacterium]
GGRTVVLCDQVEDPRQAKGLVRREITRIVTPGTVADLEALDPAAPSYLACAVQAGPALVLGMLDLLAGEVLVSECAVGDLPDEIERMGVAELLVEPATPVADAKVPVHVIDEPLAGEAAQALLLARTGNAELAGLSGASKTAACRALARLILYAESTQRRPLAHLSPPRLCRPGDTLMLDEATRRNLELVRTQLDGESAGSLLAHLDHTRTAQGARLLRQWLLFPLRDARAIGRRLDSVERLVRDRSVCAAVRAELAAVRDMERLIGRLALARATPRDLGAVRATLARLPELKRLLAMADSPLGERWAAADTLSDLGDLLCRALVDEPPLTASDGGIF